MEISLETHDYDGSLGPIFREAVARDTVNPISFEAAVARATGMISSVTKKGRRRRAAPVAPPMKTIRLLMQGDRPNWDPKNNIQARDVFRRLMSHDVDAGLIVDILFEIATKGPCVQGRTTRFLQYYLTFVG